MKKRLLKKLKRWLVKKTGWHLSRNPGKRKPKEYPKAGE